MTRSAATFFRILFLLSAVYLALPGVALGQLSLTPAAAPPPEAEPAEPEPPPISLADIPAERSAFVARKREIDADLAASAQTDEFDQELEALGERVTRLVGTSGQPLDQRSVNELFDMEVALRGDLVESRRLLARLDQAVRGLETTLDDLSTAADRWQELEQVAVDRGAPETIVEITHKTRADVDDLIARATTRRNEVLERFERMSVVEGTLDTLQAESARHRQLAQTQLLDAQTKPIWQLSPLDSAFWDSLSGQISRDATTVLEYLERYRSRLLLVLAALLAGCAWLWPRMRSVAPPADDHRGPSAMRGLRHPIAASILISVLGTGLLATGPPQPFYDLLSVIAVVPAAILVAATFGRRARPLIAVVALVELIPPFERYLALSPLLERSVLLFEALALGGVLIWQLLRSGWEETLPNARVRRFARASASLSSFLLGIVALGAVLGWISLARFLGDAVISILGSALVVLASTYLLYGIFKTLLGFWPLRDMRMVRLHPDRVTHFVRRVLVAAGVGLWTLVILDSFGVLERMPALLGRFFNLSLPLGSLTLSLGNILTFVLVVTLALWLARLVTFLLDEQFLPALPLEKGLPWAISTTVRYLILFGGFFLAAFAAGLDLTHATILVGAFSVGLGFGLQNVVNNFFSGLILMFERPIKIGDMVEIGPLAGTVTEIGIRSSRVKTFQGADVIVPNGDLIAKEVVNWTLSNRFRRLEIPIGVAYGSNIEQVMALLLEVANAHEAIVEEPPPAALLTGFGDSSIDFELRCWVSDVDRTLGVSSDLKVAIAHSLEQNDIEIPFPQRDVRVITQGGDRVDDEPSPVAGDERTSQAPR